VIEKSQTGTPSRAEQPIAPGGDQPAPEGNPSAFLDEIGLKVCASGELAEPVTAGLERAIASGSVGWTKLIDCRRSGIHEAVVFDVGVDVPQEPADDIRPTERIAVVVKQGAPDDTPEVLALRADFPRDVMHLNLRSADSPPSLCLYEVPFCDVRITWTPSAYVARIQHWLARTARGKLHRNDQELELMLPAGSNRIILPRELREAALAAKDEGMTRMNVDVTATLLAPLNDRYVLRVGSGEPKEIDGQIGSRHIFITVVRTSARVHGPMQHTPANLADLHSMLKDGGDDLLSTMRDGLKDWLGKVEKDAPYVLVVLVPHRREEGGPVEAIDAMAFFMSRLADVGVDIGAWGILEGFIMPMGLIPVDAGVHTSIELLNPTFTVVREDLAKLNGDARERTTRIVGIGTGALGSQLTLNAARAGNGLWTFVDDDVILPHNTARHVSNSKRWGSPKAVAAADAANALTEAGNIHSGIVADVLAPKHQAATLKSSFGEAGLIVDLAASVTVARAITHDVESPARRASFYLSPSGLDLTVLAEGADRVTRLDSLEMQLYRAMRNNRILSGLLADASGAVRYGRTCRDVSAEIPQWAVAMHAGIGARALADLLDHDKPRITVWRIDAATMGVVPIAVRVSKSHEAVIGEWRVVTDDAVLAMIAEYRRVKLPRETGGVLLGQYDLQRRIIYIVDVVPSPRDSREEPFAYYRGCDGLAEVIEEAQARTGGQLGYIGEWHSHPAGYSCSPSADDCKQFAWLQRVLAPEGLPTLLMIAGDDGAVPYVDRIKPGSGYPACWKLP
jgi:integrative and conjugative element protein (TIGR02256 family)